MKLCDIESDNESMKAMMDSNNREMLTLEEQLFHTNQNEKEANYLKD